MAALVVPKLDVRPILGSEDMTWFCEIIESRAGINLPPSKHDLVRSRLKSHIMEYDFQTFEEYKQLLLKLAPDDLEWQIFTNLLTTNMTDFFREPKHFDFMLKTVIPEWSKENLKVFRVWSAAASTGEEPYTLAMILSRHLPKGKDFSIVATDIDTNVLKKAKNAVYPISKQEEIPREYYLSSIEVGHGKAEGWFRIKQALKDKIKFKPYNLIGPIPLDEGVFDLVLCRNVMIYFTQENIDYVQDKIYTLTKENGYFFIGHSESLHGIKHKWTSKGPATYKKE